MPEDVQSPSKRRSVVLAKAKRLLEGSDAQAQARWEIYPDSALEEAIVNYQDSIRDVGAELLATGAGVDLVEREAGGNGGEAGAPALTVFPLL
jgi:hypothetical protein